MKKEKRFSLLMRLLGATSVVLAISATIMIATAGLSLTPGILLAVAMAGLIGPCAASADSVMDALVGIIELIGEAIMTLVDAVTSAIASLLG